MIELLSVIAILAVLMAILVPVISGLRERANNAENASRLRSLGQAIALYATETNGDLGALYQPTRRWPNLIAPLMNWVDSEAPHAEQYRQVHQRELIRPVEYDAITAAMRSGRQPVSNLGVFGLNNFFAGRGQAHTDWRLIHVERPADTPLLAAVSEDWGTHMEPYGVAPGHANFEGSTHRGGPVADRDGMMTYLMVDLSLQRRPDFWPFNEDEPWRYFHPRRSDAESLSDPAPGS